MTRRTPPRPARTPPGRTVRQRSPPAGTDRAAATGEDGFTLVEVLVAGTLGLCLVLPAYALLNGSYRTATLINSRFARDAEARQVLGLLGEGTASFGTLANARGFTMVEGIRSRGTLLSIGMLSSNGQFVMSDSSAGSSATPPSIGGDLVPQTTVHCTATGVPLPACSGTGTVTTQGWMGASPVLLQIGRSVAVDITVSDPFQASRPQQTAAGVSDTYRTLFNLNVEANP